MPSVDGPTPIHMHTSRSKRTQWVLRLEKKKLGKKRGDAEELKRMWGRFNQNTLYACVCSTNNKNPQIFEFNMKTRKAKQPNH